MDDDNTKRKLRFYLVLTKLENSGRTYSIRLHTNVYPNPNKQPSLPDPSLASEHFLKLLSGMNIYEGREERAALTSKKQR